MTGSVDYIKNTAFVWRVTQRSATVPVTCSNTGFRPVKLWCYCRLFCSRRSMTGSQNALQLQLEKLLMTDNTWKSFTDFAPLLLGFKFHLPVISSTACNFALHSFFSLSGESIIWTWICSGTWGCVNTFQLFNFNCFNCASMQAAQWGSTVSHEYQPESKLEKNIFVLILLQLTVAFSLLWLLKQGLWFASSLLQLMDVSATQDHLQSA